MTLQKLEKLRQKKQQIDAQINKVASQQRAQERKNETRRKVITGALALHHYYKNPDDQFSRKLFRLLDEYVTKPYERNLFGLPALPEEVNNLVIANDEIIEQSILRREFHGG